VRFENLADVIRQDAALSAQSVLGRLNGGDDGMGEKVNECIELFGGGEFARVERGSNRSKFVHFVRGKLKTNERIELSYMRRRTNLGGAMSV
jgi:hypothetical protein